MKTFSKPAIGVIFTLIALLIIALLFLFLRKNNESFISVTSDKTNQIQLGTAMQSRIMYNKKKRNLIKVDTTQNAFGGIVPLKGWRVDLAGIETLTHDSIHNIKELFIMPIMKPIVSNNQKDTTISKKYISLLIGGINDSNNIVIYHKEKKNSMLFEYLKPCPDNCPKNVNIFSKPTASITQGMEDELSTADNSLLIFMCIIIVLGGLILILLFLLFKKFRDTSKEILSKNTFDKAFAEPISSALRRNIPIYGDFDKTLTRPISHELAKKCKKEYRRINNPIAVDENGLPIEMWQVDLSILFPAVKDQLPEKLLLIPAVKPDDQENLTDKITIIIAEVNASGQINRDTMVEYLKPCPDNCIDDYSCAFPH